MILIAHPPSPRKFEDVDPTTLEKKDLVFLPPPALLRQLAPTPPPGARPRPVPAPTPPPQDAPSAQKKDRISVGPPSDIRMKGPMILRREDDLTKVPKGQMVPPAPPAPTPAPPAATPAPRAEVAQKGGGVPETLGREGLRLPPGLLAGPPMPRGDEGRRAQPGALGPQIAGAVDGLSRRLERDAQLGLPTGTGQNLGGLYFDPQGADFTLWVNTFKNEVYRNWILPQTAQFGFRGHVDFSFSVERDGSMTGLRMLKSSGTSSLDRAAQNALTSSRFLPLPDDYGPPRVTMQVTFFYNEAPQGS